MTDRTHSHTSRAVRDVVAERVRQQAVEGYAEIEDDQWTDGELALGAAAYITASSEDWPWNLATFKPTTERRNYVKAAALLLAEIERIDRLTDREAGPGTGCPQCGAHHPPDVMCVS